MGFDLDMTLIDTSERILRAGGLAFADLGFQIDRNAMVPYLGVPMADVAAELVPGIDTAAFMRRYRGHYDGDTETAVPVMPGARELLAEIRRRGGSSVVVSAKQQAAAVRAVADADLAELVGSVRGDLFGERKGEALHDLDDLVAYIGDHLEDANAAAAAGCPFIGVTTGVFAHEELRTAGAALTCADLREVIEWLDAHCIVTTPTVTT